MKKLPLGGSVDVRRRTMNGPFEGRPTDVSSRTDRELRAYDLLDGLGIRYVRLDHEPTNTVEACRAIDEIMGASTAKNLFLCNRQGTDFYLLMMPGNKPFKTKELSAQIGSARLSFAGAEAMESLLGLSPGSVSVLGLMNDRDCRVRLLVDEDLLSQEEVLVHPCVSTTHLKVRMRDILDRFLPAVGHGWTSVRLMGDE